MSQTQPTKVPALAKVLCSLSLLLSFIVFWAAIQYSVASNISFGEGAMLVMASIAAGTAVIGLPLAVGALRRLPRSFETFWRAAAWLCVLIHGTTLALGGCFVVSFFILMG